MASTIGAWVAMGSAACAPWRVPPATVLDHPAARVDAEQAPGPIDELPSHAEATDGEAAPDLLVRFAAPDPTRTLEVSRTAPTPRLVHRGGQEVWIGEPDRLRQHWIDEYGFPDTACPLVVAFDDGPIDLGPVAASAFELGGEEVCDDPDWPTAANPWLVLDRDGNGSIDDGRELFGSATRLPGGDLAPDGFTALAVLDADADGRITPEDPAWTQLRLWTDADRDRRSQPSELETLDARGIVALDLDGRTSPRCDARGNCEAERASMVYRAAGSAQSRRGALVDVHVRCR